MIPLELINFNKTIISKRFFFTSDWFTHKANTDNEMIITELLIEIMSVLCQKSDP